MLEVQERLNKINQCVTAILTGEPSLLTYEQTEVIQSIGANALRLLDLVPLLSQLLETRTRREAVREYSTEWRTPFTSMLGYCKLLLMGTFGQLTDGQITLLIEIQIQAEYLWNWSNADT